MIEILFASYIHTVITFIVLLILLFNVGDDKFLAPSILFILIGIYIGIWQRTEFVDWYVANKKTILTVAAAYLPFGFIYSMFKYRKMLSEVAVDRLDYHRPNFHKADITGWIIYWPFSLIGYFVTDILADLKNKLFNLVRQRFENIWRNFAQKAQSQAK